MKAPDSLPVHSDWQTPLQPIKVVIFEATRMGRELLSHALEDSEFGISVVRLPDSTNQPSDGEQVDADVAIISSSLRDGPEAGFSLLKRLSKANPRLSCIMLLDS